ncbi:MAG: penicillin-binding protein 2 [Parcubacteria bacterium C7867-005]|nr:MAG: penicillin-binding protein 2 [Parcubacteria bacterium C7867-005]
MHRHLFRRFRKSISRGHKDIDPEDIFLDSANLPGFAENRFEGRIEKPISGNTFLLVRGFLILLLILSFIKLWELQVIKGHVYKEISENNRLAHTLIFANRGVIYDRNDIELATNEVKEGNVDFAARLYAPYKGLAHVVGYLKYPLKDSSGYYYEEDYIGQAGVERIYDEILSGKNGLKITETDALSRITSESLIHRPEDGKDLNLSVDVRLTSELYKAIENTAKARGFTGGAGVIMDVNTGEILALTSYPEYDQNMVTAGKDKAEISRLFNSKDKPFLDRAVNGLYTPGSIVKPIVALAALNEKIIDPSKQILSTGSISIPNPYDKTKSSVFRDWKAHGWVDLRRALAVSSDVYFYAVGGGFEDQKGLGISNIDRYFKMFGLSEKTSIDLPGETTGVVANPEWKSKNFNGEPWRLGDTYITAIGQYGTQVSVISAVRWVGAIANEGTLLVPSVIKGGNDEDDRVFRTIDLPQDVWRIVKEGMRAGVQPGGTVTSLSHPAVAVAAKTGTAELGISKQFVNSWATGFFPYEAPKYAFAILMEKGDRANLVGASAAMQQVLNWMILNTPEYIK